MANEKAKNTLESYIFETKDWLEVDEVTSVSSEEQREEIRVAFREVSDWFEEEGYYSAETAVSIIHYSLCSTACELILRSLLTIHVQYIQKDLVYT